MRFQSRALLYERSRSAAKSHEYTRFKTHPWTVF